MTVHNTEQNSSDNLPSYLQTNIIAEMLSIRGEGTNHFTALWILSGQPGWASTRRNIQLL